MPESIIYDSSLSDRAVRLYAVLCRHADEGGVCWPSRARLASLLGCSADSVDRALAELLKAGAITKHRPGRRATNRYKVSLHPRALTGPRVRTSAEGESAPTRTVSPHRCGTEREPENESQRTKDASRFASDALAELFGESARVEHAARNLVTYIVWNGFERAELIEFARELQRRCPELSPMGLVSCVHGACDDMAGDLGAWLDTDDATPGALAAMCQWHVDTDDDRLTDLDAIARAELQEVTAP